MFPRVYVQNNKYFSLYLLGTAKNIKKGRQYTVTILRKWKNIRYVDKTEINFYNNPKKEESIVTTILMCLVVS